MTTVASNGKVGDGPALAPRPAVDAVRDAALELLAALPRPPQRLRVSAADVTLELDWQTQPAAPAAPAADPVEPALDTARYVCSPSVGTFYRAAQPGAEPYVVEGGQVTAGQQIGIVEAMKLMIPVESDLAGRVERVLVPDGQPVEYGERLLMLAPAQG